MIGWFLLIGMILSMIIYLFCAIQVYRDVFGLRPMFLWLAIMWIFIIVISIYARIKV